MLTKRAGKRQASLARCFPNRCAPFEFPDDRHSNNNYCPPIGGSFEPAGCVPLTWMVLELASV